MNQLAEILKRHKIKYYELKKKRNILNSFIDFSYVEIKFIWYYFQGEDKTKSKSNSII